MYDLFKLHLNKELAQIQQSGLLKDERIILSPQDAAVTLLDGRKVLNFCANNYLGLSNHPVLKDAAISALETHGYGMSSVRFICGTQNVHKQLEEDIARFFHMEDTLLYAACFDANGGVFEPLLGAEDAIISDELNHASIIDGIRLCKAHRYRYANANMDDLEKQLQLASQHRFKLIVTDGVFSMDGNVAPLDTIYVLAQKYNAMIMVDESHSAGVIGETGRGATELFDLKGKIEIITGTLGKAFGGAIGGFTTGKKEIIELLRQRSRPYLFSNSLPPMVAAAGSAVFQWLEKSNALTLQLQTNTAFFVDRMLALGFDIKPTQSAICAVMLYDAKLAQQFAAKMLDEGIYVIGFSYPVVPKDMARIRVQISAAHETDHLHRCVNAFQKVGRQLGVIS